MKPNTKVASSIYMKHNLNLYMTGYIHDSLYQSAILQSIDLSRYDDVIFHTSGFSSLMCYMFLLNKLHLYVPYILKLGIDGVSKFHTYRRIVLFLNRIPFGVGKYVILLIDIISVLINAFQGFIYTHDDFVRLINYVDRSEQCNETPKKNKRRLLQKINVHVYNITTNRSEIVNGSHPLFKRYLLASLSRLTFFEPIKIQLLSNECRCDEDCTQCIKLRKNKSMIFVSPEGCDICTCDNMSHRYNDYVDCDINGPFLIQKQNNCDSNKDESLRISNLIILSNCVKEQRMMIVRKTNFLARTMDLLKYTTQHKVDDIVDKICSKDKDIESRTICINYIRLPGLSVEKNEIDKTKEINNGNTYTDFNPAGVYNLSQCYNDGSKMRKLINNSLTESDKDRIYIECTSD